MKNALAELFSSKKFLVMIATILAYIAARFGLDVDPDKIYPALFIVAGWLGAQGIADHGKSAAVEHSFAATAIAPALEAIANAAAARSSVANDATSTIPPVRPTTPSPDIKPAA